MKWLKNKILYNAYQRHLKEYMKNLQSAMSRDLLQKDFSQMKHWIEADERCAKRILKLIK